MKRRPTQSLYICVYFADFWLVHPSNFQLLINEHELEISQLSYRTVFRLLHTIQIVLLFPPHSSIYFFIPSLLFHFDGHVVLLNNRSSHSVKAPISCYPFHERISSLIWSGSCKSFVNGISVTFRTSFSKILALTYESIICSSKRKAICVFYL